MIAGNKKVLAVCLAIIHDESQTKIMKSLCACAEKKGYEVQVFNVFTDLYNKDNNDFGEQSIFELIRYDLISAMIIFSETIKDKNVVRELIARSHDASVPVVSIDSEYDDCYNVLYDYSGSFEKIVKHVVNYHKCKKVAFIAGIKGNDFSEGRINVFRDIMHESGCGIRPEWIQYGDFWEAPAEKACNKILDAYDDIPECIICANDVMAITACQVLSRRGIKVPEDVIVTGFDGYEQGAFYTPKLTTAVIDKSKAGLKAVEIADMALSGQTPEHNTYVEYKQIFSESCGCQEIISANTNDHIVNLYGSVASFKFNQVNMHTMVVRLTDGLTVDDIAGVLKHYIVERACRSFSICVNTRFFESSDKISITNKSQDSMVLLCQQLGDNYTTPYTEFSSKDILPNYQEAVSGSNIILMVPLHCQQKIFGYMVICDRIEHIELIRIFELAINLDHAFDTVINQTRLIKMNNKLNQLYSHDPLTGIFNRRGFYQEFYKILDANMDKAKYIYVYSIDLNMLKYINDNFGHNEGDFTIKTIARFADMCVGNNGVCARFGGDEFVGVVFSDSEPEIGCSEFTDKMKRSIDEFNADGIREYEIGASIGCDYAKIDENIDIDMLIRSADKKMYVEKGRTKNRHSEESGRD